jgi:hypothetical protein
MKRDIQQVLDECVESMLNGTSTLEECVSRLGNEMRAEVEPMLFAVKRVTDDADVKPNEIKKQSGKTVFLAAVEQKRWESGVERKVLLERKVGKDPYILMKRLAVLMGVIITLSGATIAMASESLPGNVLYPVKRAVENARINLTPEGGNKQLLYMQAAENRMDELEKLKKDDANYPVVMQDMAESLEKATSVTGSEIADRSSDKSDQNVLQPRIQEQLNERLAIMEQRREKNIANKLNAFAPGLKPLIEKELARLGKLKGRNSVAGAEENFLPASSQAGKTNNGAGSLPGDAANKIDNAAPGNKGLSNGGLKNIGDIKNSAISGKLNKNAVGAARTRETNSTSKDSTGAKVKLSLIHI